MQRNYRHSVSGLLAAPTWQVCILVTPPNAWKVQPAALRVAMVLCSGGHVVPAVVTAVMVNVGKTVNGG